LSGYRTLLALDALHDDVAVTIDHDVEHERTATDRAVLDEALAPARRRVDADGIFFEARRAGIEGVRFNRHAMAFMRCR